MILNVSGRTDIIAFYSKWFIKRLEEGFVDVRNPFYPSLVSRIYFKDVDAFMFCTKNPIPIIDYLPNIDKPILFHITITPYNKDIEPNVYNKKLVIEAVKKISKIIGCENVYVRYDPIFLNDKYNLEYHKRAFNKLCMMLSGCVKKIIVSFIDDYKNVRANINTLKIKDFTLDDYKEIGVSFSSIAKTYGMEVFTCCENETLVNYGFIKDDCFSVKKAYELTGKKFGKWKARGGHCNCAMMVDIGAYNTCSHFCKYCYANYDEMKVLENIKEHDDSSSLLIGKIKEDDIIKVRKD